MRWLLALLLLGCGETPTTVFAAASLTDALGELGGARFHFAGSHRLLLQIEQGAPADVVVVADAEMLPDAVTVTCNAPVVVVPRGNPAGITGVADLARAHRLVLGVPEVPVGRHAAALVDSVPGLRSRLRVASYALDARQVLAAVALGEADAGVVYRTDATAREEVEVIEVEPALRRVARYGAQARTPRGRAWLARLRSDEGRRALARHGFSACRASVINSQSDRRGPPTSYIGQSRPLLRKR